MDNITLTHTFLSSPDQDAAVDFYTRVLGLEVRTDVVMEGIGMRWLTVGTAAQPELEINLMNPADVPGGDEHQAGTLIFSIPDCESAFDHVKGSGAEVEQEPTRQPYGVIDCSFLDPNGNHVRFSQVL
jgi:predicted enzyme related to lactoylglutathione lyase